jgi:hypothetical protein
MKVTETTHNDGQAVTREFQIPLYKGIPRVCHLLIPDEEPFVIKIIESGWRGTYHVISEWGDTGNSDYTMMDISQLLETYPEFQTILDELYPDTVVSTRELLDNANDKDLGAAIRKKSADLNKSQNPTPGEQLEIQF